MMKEAAWAWSGRNVFLAGPMCSAAVRAKKVFAGSFKLVPRKIERFKGEQSGAVALLFGLAFIPLALGMGVALDWARAQQRQQALLHAVDTAGLAVAKLPAGTDIHVVRDQAAAFVDAALAGKNVSPEERGSVVVAVERAEDGLGYSISAHLDMGLTLSKVRAVSHPDGLDKLRVRASNAVDWELGTIELALVLDTTKSMDDDGKMDALKPAADQFLKTLRDAAKKPGQVRVSLVPYAEGVRVNPALKNAPWLDRGTSPAGKEMFLGQSVNRFALFEALDKSWSGCLEMRPMPYDVREDAADPSDSSTLYVPHFAPDEPDFPNRPVTRTVKVNGHPVEVTKTESYYPNDYLTDDHPNHPDWKAAQGSLAKYTEGNLEAKEDSDTVRPTGKGPNEGCDKSQLPAIIPLVDAKDASYQDLLNAAAAMDPHNNTNIPIGLAWGWNTLSPHGPALAGEERKGKPYGTKDLMKFIVLMTDGENTFEDPTKFPGSDKDGYCGVPDPSESENKNRSEYQAMGYVWQNRLGFPEPPPPFYGCMAARREKMNGRLRELCGNIKQRGIQIFTIGLKVDSAGRPVLQDCADPGRFYNVQDVSQLDPVFQDIAQKIQYLRLTQ